jgi:hypothetical protein
MTQLHNFNSLKPLAARCGSGVALPGVGFSSVFAPAKPKAA